MSDVAWLWIQRLGEAITLLGLGLHAYRKARAQIAALGSLIDKLESLPELERRVEAVERDLTEHKADHVFRPPSPSHPAV